MNSELIKAIEKRESEKSFLIKLNSDIAAIKNKQELLDMLCTNLNEVGFYGNPDINILNDSRTAFKPFIPNVDSEANRIWHKHSGDEYTCPEGMFKIILKANEPLFFSIQDFLLSAGVPEHIKLLCDTGVEQIAVLGLRDQGNYIGAILFFSEETRSFTVDQLLMVKEIAQLTGIAVANILFKEKIEQQLKEINYYKSLLEEENQYLQQQIKTVFNSGDDMVGYAGGLKGVSDLISRVAGSDTTVLILGETGTGKELVARALHNASPRKGKLMIKVNCAALPATLIESELFGHEKGSFTGATERRIGKFELAHNGTLFLDEIGELELDLQVKLLRALQEKEVERIGGKEVVKTNVRIIAATNRNLHEEVWAGRFRSDLYYRLNVFPINIPSLKERKQDIPVLVSHFINKLSGRLGKNITGISTDAMRDLTAHTWPGNVRELEHVIERSALMAKDTMIRDVYMLNNSRTVMHLPPEVVKIKSLDESERDHIKTMLARCNGKIKGSEGAAELLGLPPTTLHSKMKKLGITKDDY